ncbi:MAG: hypothetical protein LBU32_16780 [Clostridiales bacterium]|nr:hypothetical protein [Clostridiales bacterium]
MKNKFLNSIGKIPDCKTGRLTGWECSGKALGGVAGNALGCESETNEPEGKEQTKAHAEIPFKSL